jgi:hypothetical protein
MGVTLVNGSVLLPHRPFWADGVAWSRAWQTGVTAALTGDEQRRSMRSLPRDMVSFSIAALSLEDRAQLDERLDAATKSGLGCAPFWGRGSALANALNAGNTAVVLSDTSWNWVVNDWYFICALCTAASGEPELLYDYGQVTVVAGADLTLGTAASNSYPAGSLLWPLLFGKFAVEKATADDSWRVTVKISLSELTARRQAVVGNPPGMPGVGVGSWAVGSTFVVN